MENDALQNLWKEILQGNNVLMVLHLTPDADCVGANLALKNILEKMGKKVTVVSAYKPSIESFSEISMDVINYIDPCKLDLSEFDLFLGLDLAGEHRITEDTTFKICQKLKCINIDHHKDNDNWGEINYIDTQTSSCCALVYKLIKKNNINITKEITNLLLAGHVRDCGFFLSQDVKPADLVIASELMTLGGSLFDIMNNEFNKQSFILFKIKKIAYTNLHVNYEKRYAYSWLTLKDLKKEGLSYEESSTNIVDNIKKLEKVDFVFALMQQPSGYYKVSFRSCINNFDVHAFAQKLGGGGHTLRSSALLNNVSNLKKALKIVLEAIS